MASSFDYTAEIFSLQNARGEMQAAKARNRAEIMASYKAKMELDIKEADRAAELRFARLLREANAAGVPQALLRSEVLRTNVWSRWTYWRDLADIEPERKVIADAKAAKAEQNKPYAWDDTEDNILWWRVDKKGVLLPEPIRMEIVEHRPLAPEISYAHRMILREHLGNLNTFLNDVAGPIILERFPKEDS